MKQLMVPPIALQDPHSMTALAALLQELPHHPLEQKPWQDAYPYKPEVQFSIAYNSTHLFLHYTVAEKAIRAISTEVNGPVWEDSCVEFFLGLGEEGYYNFEFNCIGTALAAYGPSQTDRHHLPAQMVRQITTLALIDRQPGQVHWELTVRIPFTVLLHHPAIQLPGLQARANFYKCGDLLPAPHFLSWSGIESPTPNFHLPAFFGQLQFA